MNEEFTATGADQRTGGDAQTKSVPPPDRSGSDPNTKGVEGTRTGGDAQTKGIEA